MTSSKFQEALDRRKREADEHAAVLAEKKRASGSITDSSDPLAEFVPTDEQTRSDEDAEMDRVMGAIDVLTAYKKWCGKSNPNPRPGQRESIKVSCPWPEHTDEHASASLNVDKDVFMCHGTCEKGGDKYDLAAIRFGFDLSTYKQGENFHRLRRAMAESMGYTFVRSPGKKEYTVEAPAEINKEPDLEPEPVAEDIAPVSTPLAVVTPISSDDEETEDDFFYKQAILVDYAKFIKPDTFLDTWMRTLKIDDAPDDFHFWHGMIALGFAGGRDVRLVDKKGTVYGNLNICLVAPSGSGKSRSKRHLDELFRASGMNFNPQNEPPTGVKSISGANSGEMLIKYFEHFYSPDPTNPKMLELAPIKGLIEFSEFSTIAAIASRRGSTLEQAIMKIFDCEHEVASASLTTGEKKARDPFGSIITTVQPRALKRLVNQAALDNGFANRFLFASGLPKTVVEFGGDIPDITPAVAPFEFIKGWCMSMSHAGGIPIFLTDESKAYANEFFNKNIHPVQGRDETGLLTRIVLTMKKMILLNAINEKCEGVTPEMLERTFSILPYLLRAAGASGTYIGESKDQEIVRNILEAVARHNKQNPNKGISTNEIRVMYKRKKYEISDVNKALENLAKIGELEKVESQRGVGRPTVRYRIAQ